MCVDFPHMSARLAPPKFPTVIYYDRSGKVRAVGAEAVREGICDVAEDEKWVKTEY